MSVFGAFLIRKCSKNEHFGFTLKKNQGEPKEDLQFGGSPPLPIPPCTSSPPPPRPLPMKRGRDLCLARLQPRRVDWRPALQTTAAHRPGSFPRNARGGGCCGQGEGGRASPPPRGSRCSPPGTEDTGPPENGHLPNGLGRPRLRPKTDPSGGEGGLAVGMHPIVQSTKPGCMWKKLDTFARRPLSFGRSHWQNLSQTGDVAGVGAGPLLSDINVLLMAKTSLTSY